MQTRPERGGTRRARGSRMLLYALSILLMVSGIWTYRAGAAGQESLAAASASHAQTMYTAIPLSENQLPFSVDINARSQVALNELFPDELGAPYRDRFFDGTHFHTIAAPVPQSVVAINDAGQVTGTAEATAGAFRWSERKGLVALGRSGASGGYAINDKGEVVGIDRGHAARWTADNREQDLGSLFGGLSFALATNDAGTVVGASDQRPFRWTPADGMRQIGMFSSDRARATDINAAGYIVGEVPFSEGGPGHAFLWSPKSGLMDLLPGTGFESEAIRINQHGMVIGNAFPTIHAFGFAWTRDTGPVKITNGTVQDLNRLGQVVGGDARLHAFVWRPATGAVDLNTRVRNLPRNLKLELGGAISDDGDIVAFTNSGTVLLTRRSVSNQAPLVGQIIFPDRLRAGVLTNLVAYFTDVDAGQTHTASWDYDDGTIVAGTVNGKYGSGSVSGQHVFSEGDFRIRLTVTDSSGKSTTVRITLTFEPPCTCIHGQGAFLSPANAATLMQAKAGLARFAFAAPVGNARAKTSFRLDAPGLHFRSTGFDAQADQGAQLKYRGSGTLNGAGGYRFLLSVARPSAGAGADSIGVRIWHRDPRSGADVLDYDNMLPGGQGIGMPVADGAIVVDAD